MSHRDFDFDGNDLDGLHEFLLTSDLVQGPPELWSIVEENWPELLERIVPPRERLH